MRLIDADKLLDNLKALDPSELHFPMWYIAKIENMPPIDPVRHGHWEELPKNVFKPSCSKCGNTPIVKYAWCHWCGAKMDEVIE